MTHTIQETFSLSLAVLLMGYARSALKSFKYSGYDTLCCSDLSLSPTFEKHWLHSLETKWNIDLCAYWPALIDVSFVSFRLYRCLSVWFLDACSHRPHSIRGQWCFYLLSFAKMSFNSSVNMDSFQPCSPARDLTGIPSLFLSLTPFPPAFPRL